ncbi:MAG: hypothetical protein Q9161_008588 [Pseudevernia consocians]
MTYPNLDSLLIVVDLSGDLADAAFALPENSSRRLLESAEESSIPNPEVQLLRPGNALRVKLSYQRNIAVLSRQKWLRLESGMSWMVNITGNLIALLFTPDRGNQQADYDRNLQDYLLEYKNAVPQLAHISLRGDEVTPFILDRCAGLDGHEYYSTRKFETGDLDYDSKVFGYFANCKSTLDEIQGTAGEYEEKEDWLYSNPKGNPVAKLYIIKHFRDKSTDLAIPQRFPELCRLSHPNLEDLVDMITETSVFMTVSEKFSRTTLHALLQEETLGTKDAGFMLGQVFGALEYLHARRWTHGNLDPRSIQVMSRDHLWIKLTDIALSDYVDLGKPDGYHATYASQPFQQADKSPADIWSAGVVALQILPNGLPPRTIKDQSRWVKRLQDVAGDRDRELDTDVTAFVRSVLVHHAGHRLKASEVLKDRFIVRVRGELYINGRYYNFPTPQGSRDTSLGPSNASYNTHYSATGGPGSSSSQSRIGGGRSLVSDWAPGAAGRVESQRDADIKEESGEETETGKGCEPVTKKPRRREDEPTHQMKRRSQGKKPR